MFKLTDEQIEKATTWWADRVRAPTFDGLSDKERKAPRNWAYELGEVMTMSRTKPVDDKQREKFIEALEAVLRSPKYNPYRGLSVDYHPDLTLRSAAEKAGVPLDNFPWKTWMQFDGDGTVRAASGYGAAIQIL